MNYFLKLFIIWATLTNCNPAAMKPYNSDFVFAKIGSPENANDKSIQYGSQYLIKYETQTDSLLIRYFQMSDEIDSISWVKPHYLKSPIPEIIKKAFLDFYDYADTLSNGELPNTYFNDHAQIIYCGGTYVIQYIDKRDQKRYFAFLEHNLSTETTKLLYNIKKLVSNQYDSVNSKRPVVNTINFDSIVSSICIQPNVGHIIIPPRRVDAPPLKFIAPTELKSK